MSATETRVDATPGPRLDRTVIAQVAAERGWKTIRAVADGLGIHTATYYRFLNGDLSIRLATAHQLAERTGRSVNELFPSDAA